MNLKERAKRLKDDIPALFIAMKMKETPFAAKLLGAIAVCYALSPIDLIPDFIPVLGLLDDLIILPALVALVVKLIPAEIFEKCRMQAQRLWSGGKPRRWYYALPIIFIWLAVAFAIINIFL